MPHIICARIYRYEYTIATRARRAWGVTARSVPTDRYRPVDAKTEPIYKIFKRQKSVYRLVTAPQGGTQKYTLTFAYDAPR